MLEDDEVLELDDNYNEESDEDYRDNPGDEHDDDHDISESESPMPSPAPSPRPPEALSPTAIALRNMTSPNRDPGAAHRYGRDAEDAILAATGRPPRLAELDPGMQESDQNLSLPHTARGSAGTPPDDRSPRSAATRDSPRGNLSPRGSNPSSPRFSSPSSPRAIIEGPDGTESLRSPVTIRLRPKLSRANSSFMRIVNAAKALPDDLDISGKHGADDNNTDDDEDSDLDIMERVEVDSDGDHFSDVLLTDDDGDITDDRTDDDDDDDDSNEEKGLSYDRVFGGARKGKSPRYGDGDYEKRGGSSDFSATETDESTDTNSSSMDVRPTSPRVITVETIGERSREHSSGEDSDDDTDDSIDRTQFETVPTLPTMNVSSPNRLSIDKSPRNNISPRASPRRGDGVSLASSVASIGPFEHAPTAPSMPSSSGESPTSARSDNGTTKDDNNNVGLNSSSSVPSSPIHKKSAKSTKRPKKKK